MDPSGAHAQNNNLWKYSQNYRSMEESILNLLGKEFFNILTTLLNCSCSIQQVLENNLISMTARIVGTVTHHALVKRKNI